MVEYLADILGEQVARQAFLYALSGSGERFGGMKQGFVMAGVENYGCSRVVQIVRAYALAQRTEQSVQMSFELGLQPFDGNGYPFSESCLLGCEFLRIQPVAFVQDDDEPLFGPERNPGVEGAYFFRVVAGIGYQQYDGSLAYPIVRSLDTHAFERVVGFADTCRIDEAERQSVYVQRLFDDVARRACDVGYQGSVFFQQGVQQGGLADVRSAGNGYGNTVFDRVAQCERGYQSGYFPFDGRQYFEQLFPIGKLHVFFAEVQFQLE